jgi:hypothetical protein
MHLEVASNESLSSLAGTLAAFRDRIVDAIDWTFLRI